jgi:hypothetical protein
MLIFCGRKSGDACVLQAILHKTHEHNYRIMEVDVKSFGQWLQHTAREKRVGFELP